MQISIQSFIEHNKKVFRQQNNEASDSVVLLEVNRLCSAHISYSYFANSMANYSKAELVAYDPVPRTQWMRWLLRRQKPSQHEDVFEVYQSFGAKRFLKIDPCPWRAWRVFRLAKKLKKELKTKKAIEALSLNNIRIGDLLYDSYLRDLRKPTIELNSKEWFKYLKKFLNLFLFWEDYFKKTNVVAVNVSHCVYELAIPLRIAIFKNIPAFQVNITHAYRLDKKNLFAYNDFHYFKNNFKKIPAKIKNKGLEEAKTRIARRFRGEVGIDMEYSRKSAFGKIKTERLLRLSQKKKILIATHCFFDSPHSYGDNAFPDFYEWLEFLGKFSQKSNYDWYIKTHPDYLPGTMEVIQEFLKKYPKLILLPPDSSHHQIVKEGIDLALTVYGTIGFEYAILGIPVINASKNNPHVNYSFNLHAKTQGEYKKLLSNRKIFYHRIQKNEVYEFYFMKNIHNSENIIFEDYNKTIAHLGDYNKQFLPPVYDRWIKEWSFFKHEKILNMFHNFIHSKCFRMGKEHGISFPARPCKRDKE